MKKLLVLALMLTSTASFAQLLKVKLNCTGSYATFCDDIESQFQDQINGQDVPEAPIGKFADQMANAISISTAGQGSDYANLFDIFVVSINPIAVGADVDMSNIDNAKSAGVALSPSMTVGINLDVLPIDKVAGVELKNFDVFFNYFSQKNDKMIDQDGTTVGGEISNFGAHIRYKWIAPKSALGGLFQWNGVQVHTGYRFAKNKLSAAYNLGTTDPVGIDMNGNGTNDVNLNLTNAITTASIKSTSHTIPVEISTAARALYLFTFYTGAGFDYNIKSTSEIDVNASGSIASNKGDVTGTIIANQGADGKGSATNFRGFFGVQTNIWMLKLGAQVQKSLSNDTLAVNVGAKIAW